VELPITLYTVKHQSKLSPVKKKFIMHFCRINPQFSCYAALTPRGIRRAMAAISHGDRGKVRQIHRFLSAHSRKDAP
jgi:hypothetical protein